MSFTEYRHQSQAQFQVLVEQVKTRDDKLEMMIVGIKLVLDYIGLEPYHPWGDVYPVTGYTTRWWIVARQRGWISRSWCTVRPMELSSMHSCS